MVCRWVGFFFSNSYLSWRHNSLSLMGSLVRSPIRVDLVLWPLSFSSQKLVSCQVKLVLSVRKQLPASSCHFSFYLLVISSLVIFFLYFQLSVAFSELSIILNDRLVAVVKNWKYYTFRYVIGKVNRVIEA